MKNNMLDDRFLFIGAKGNIFCHWKPKKKTLEKIRTKNGVLPNIISYLRRKMMLGDVNVLVMDGLGVFNRDDAVTILSIALFSGFKYIKLPWNWIKQDFIQSAKKNYGVEIINYFEKGI